MVGLFACLFACLFAIRACRPLVCSHLFAALFAGRPWNSWDSPPFPTCLFSLVLISCSLPHLFVLPTTPLGGVGTNK